jgi:hypothetical protein
MTLVDTFTFERESAGVGIGGKEAVVPNVAEWNEFMTGGAVERLGVDGVSRAVAHVHRRYEQAARNMVANEPQMEQPVGITPTSEA